MLKEERQRYIRRIIEDQGQVSVATLARQFGVAEMTIRRDLRELGAQGIIQRVRGGALLPERQHALIEPPVLERINEEAAAKKRIGQAAAALIAEGETIFLGSGTTTLAVAQALRERRNITVVTNALTVINALTDSDLTVVVAGGFFRRSELSFIGHITEASIRDLRVDKVIIGMRGIDPEYGLTSDHLQELQTDQAIMRIGNMVIIVADHTKFGRVATSRVAPVTVAKMIITDSEAPPAIVAALREMGIEVIQV